MFCVSTGNIFSGRSAGEQSTRVFAVSILLWTNLFQWLCVSANYAVPMMTQRFLSDPDTRPKFVICWMKVMRGTYRVAIPSSLLTLAVGTALTHVPNSLREFRLQFYVSVLCYHMDTTACNIESTRTYREEIVHGRHPKWRDELHTGRSSRWCLQKPRRACLRAMSRSSTRTLHRL